MWLFPDRSPGPVWTSSWLWARVLAGLILLLAAGFCWQLFCRIPQVRQGDAARHLSLARQQAAEGRMDKARFSAALALKANPASAEACSIVAQAAERSGSAGEALIWHRRAFELAPTMDNRLRLASALVQRELPPCAESGALLEGAPEPERNSLGFHLVSARWALRRGDARAAEEHFRQAIVLDPGRPLHQLNLASVLLVSASAEKAGEGRSLLEALVANPAAGADALRSLLQDALNRADPDSALRHSRALLARKEATLKDRLKHLDLVFLRNDESWQARLAELQKEAQQNASAVHQVGVWMIEHRLADALLAWIGKLPVSVQRSQPVPQVVAMAYTQQGNWAGLERWIAAERWGEADCLRQLHLLRAQRSLNRTSEAEQTKARLMLSAATEPEMLALVGEVSRTWGWTSDAEEALWAIAKRFPAHAWALEQLEHLYQGKADAKGLSEVARFRAAQADGDAGAGKRTAQAALPARTSLAQSP